MAGNPQAKRRGVESIGGKMMKASPSAYWDKVRILLKPVEDEAIEAQDYFEKALDNISEAREQL